MCAVEGVGRVWTGVLIDTQAVEVELWTWSAVVLGMSKSD